MNVTTCVGVGWPRLLAVDIIIKIKKYTEKGTLMYASTS